MKVRRSDIGRFLHFVRKTWKSTIEDDSQTVVFTVIESGYSIGKAKDGLLLTYLCNRVDFEAGDQSIALPFAFLLDDTTRNGVLELTEVIENGEGYVLAKWYEGYVQSEQKWPALGARQYHLLPDLAWHTIDERQLIMRGCSRLHSISLANR